MNTWSLWKENLKLDHASWCAAQFPQVTFATSIPDFGVTLSFSAHISNLSQSSSYHLCSLHAIRRSVFMPTLSSMVHMPLSVPGLTIVTPSSFAHKSPAQLHFSAILNASACLIAHTSGFSHVSTFIKEKLHWLPLSARILFRIFFLIFFLI